MQLTPDYLELIGYLLILTFLIHFPFIGLIIGSSSLSFIFHIFSYCSSNKMYTHLAKDLINRSIGRNGVILIFGLVPIIIISLIFTQIYFPHAELSSYVWFYIMVIVIVSFILLTLYHNGLSSRNTPFIFYTGIGFTGIGLLLIAYFFFIHFTSLTLYPEKWSFIQNPWQITFSPNAFVKYGYFLAFSFSWTGAVSLLPPRIPSKAIEHSSNPTNHGKSDYNSFLRKVGISLSLSFSLALPILLFLNLMTLPSIARSSFVYHLSIAAIPLLFLISLFLVLMLQKEERNFGTIIISLFLLSFLVWSLSDHETRGEALKESLTRMAILAEEAQMERELFQKQKATETAMLSEKSGEEIFNERCTACHRFDEVLLGPPLRTVLPKYKSNIDELKSFIANPHKIDPSYPAMPQLGLNKKEIESVAFYVIQKMDERSE